ncbi:MAG: (Fe-S)-binding protein, partial [Candidatus Binataceae bacterium]
FKQHAPLNPGGREVVLFADTFNNFFEPEVAIAAVRVLERTGFRVSVPDRDLCCGRPLYDQGLLDRARRRLTEVRGAFAPYLRRGTPIVGLEPSCLLTFRDEMPGLFPDDTDARELARRAMLLDEFLTTEEVNPALPKPELKAILHGHCHQKSLAGLANETSLLRRIFAERLDVLDSGCCGMAGAFGYDAKHFEISRSIGERVLMPAIRQAAAGTFIIADGFACRSQIRQFCPGRQPLHLSQILDIASRTSESEMGPRNRVSCSVSIPFREPEMRTVDTIRPRRQQAFACQLKTGAATGCRPCLLNQ